MPEDKSPEEPLITETPALNAPEAEVQPQAFPVETTSTIPDPQPSVPSFGETPAQPDNLTTPQKMPKKKKYIIIGAIIVGALALLTAGTAAAYNLWYQNPNKVVMESIGSLLKSGTSTNKIVFEMKSKDGAVKISVDAKLAESPATETDVDATLSFSGKDYHVKGSTLTDKDGNLYFKIQDVKTLLTQIAGSDVDLSAFNNVITKIDGQWVKISADDLKSVNEDYGKTQTCTTNALKSLDDKTVSNEIVDVYQKNQFLIVGNKIGVKDINGTASLGYAISFDGEKAKAFYVALGSTKFGKALTTCDSSYTFKASDLDSLTTKDATKGDIQIWASRFGHQLKEVDISAKDNDNSASIIWNPTFVKGVTVAAPTTSVPLKDVITEVENILIGNTAP